MSRAEDDTAEERLDRLRLFALAGALWWVRLPGFRARFLERRRVALVRMFGGLS